MSIPIAKTQPLFTRNFLLICLTTLIGFTGFYLLLTTLPMYVLQLGGHEGDVGLVIGAITITAVAFRPIIGVQSDQRGRRIVLRIGIVGFLVAMALYALSNSVPSLVLLRLFHGVFWAAVSTTLSTLIADIAPPSRRGEAMGYYGISSNVAMAVGPALGIAIVNAFSFLTLFLVCTGLSLLTVFIGLLIPETHQAIAAPARPESKGKASMLTLDSLFPSIVIFFVSLSYGAVVSFLPLYAKGFHVDNPGLFFTIFAIVVLLSRPLFGRLSDRLGRGTLIIPGIAFIVVAMVVLSLSGSLPMLVLVGILFGLGFGAAQQH